MIHYMIIWCHEFVKLPVNVYSYVYNLFEIETMHEHEKIKFISTSGHVIFCLLYINILMMTFLTIFRRFPTSFRRFPKTFQNFSEGKANIFRSPYFHLSFWSWKSNKPSFQICFVNSQQWKRMQVQHSLFHFMTLSDGFRHFQTLSNSQWCNPHR